MYNACEWGNYCRVGSTAAGSRQVGRRAIVSYAAMVVAPDSPVYTPQQLANRVIGVPFYFGTHYIAMHMLQGFVRREEVKLCFAPNGSRYRLEAVLNGEIDAATLTEPHVSLAEKKGCRIISEALFHGTEVLLRASMRRPMLRSIARCVRRYGASTPTSAPTCTISLIITARQTLRSPH